jgi:hypothetical protein
MLAAWQPLSRIVGLPDLRQAEASRSVVVQNSLLRPAGVAAATVDGILRL